MKQISTLSPALLPLFIILLAAADFGYSEKKKTTSKTKPDGPVYRFGDFQHNAGSCLKIKVEKVRSTHAVGIVCSKEDWDVLLKHRDKIECWIRAGRQCESQKWISDEGKRFLIMCQTHICSFFFTGVQETNRWSYTS